MPEHLVVIGAGYIGLELGSVWRRLGAKVTVLEYLDRILPGMDAEIAREAERIFEKQGIEFQLGRARHVRQARRRRSASSASTAKTAMRCDRVLLAVGRVPNTDELGLDSVGIELDPRGRVPIDDHFRTNVPGIYAIGDVVRGPMLAHKAEEEGVACVEQHRHRLRSRQLRRDSGRRLHAPGDRLRRQDRRRAEGAGRAVQEGHVPVHGQRPRPRARRHRGPREDPGPRETDRILGVHIIGPRAGDLIAEAAVAIEFSASAEDIARSSHAHPTLAEAMKEAALAVDRRAIHI